MSPWTRGTSVRLFKTFTSSCNLTAHSDPKSEVDSLYNSIGVQNHIIEQQLLGRLQLFTPFPSPHACSLTFCAPRGPKAGTRSCPASPPPPPTLAAPLAPARCVTSRVLLCSPPDPPRGAPTYSTPLISSPFVAPADMLYLWDAFRVRRLGWPAQVRAPA